MIDTASVIIAIVIGLFTSGIYWLTQRKQLTSAKNERVKRANEKIVNIMCREIIRDDRKFTFDDIDHLISTQASIDELHFTVLDPPHDIVDKIFYKILENEYLEKNHKDKLLYNVKNISKAIEKEYKKISKEMDKEVNVSISPPIAITVLVGFITIILSMMILFFDITYLNFLDIYIIIIVFIMIILFFARYITRFYL